MRSGRHAFSRLLHFSQLMLLLALCSFPRVSAAESSHSSPSNVAKADDGPGAFPSLPPLASYDTLMSVSPAVREHYIDQLRILMVDLAADSQVRKLDLFAETLPPRSDFQYLFGEIFQFARAEPGLPPSAPLPPSRPAELQSHCKNAKNKPVPIWTDGRYFLCPEGLYSTNGNTLTTPYLTPDAYNEALKKNSETFETKHADELKKNRDECSDLVKVGGGEEQKRAYSWNEDQNRCSDIQRQNQGYGDDGKKSGSCIFAGNVSQYEKKGRHSYCKPVQSVCLDGTIPASGGSCPDKKKPLSCKGNHAVCNPLFFGLKGADKPFCVPFGGGVGQNATRNCSALNAGGSLSVAKGAKAADQKIPEKNDRSWAEDYLGVGDTESKKKAWDKFVKDFKSLCDVDAKDKLARNCEACMVMRRRLMALNGRILLAQREPKSAKLSGVGKPPRCAWSPTEIATSEQLEHADKVYKKEDKTVR